MPHCGLRHLQMALVNRTTGTRMAETLLLPSLFLALIVCHSLFLTAATSFDGESSSECFSAFAAIIERS